MNEKDKSVEPLIDLNTNTTSHYKTKYILLTVWQSRFHQVNSPVKKKLQVSSIEVINIVERTISVKNLNLDPLFHPFWNNIHFHRWTPTPSPTKSCRNSLIKRVILELIDFVMHYWLKYFKGHWQKCDCHVVLFKSVFQDFVDFFDLLYHKNHKKWILSWFSIMFGKMIFRFSNLNFWKIF